MKTTCNFSVDYLLISDKCPKKISGHEVGNAGASKADFWHAYIKKRWDVQDKHWSTQVKSRTNQKNRFKGQKKKPQTNKIN